MRSIYHIREYSVRKLSLVSALSQLGFVASWSHHTTSLWKHCVEQPATMGLK